MQECHQLASLGSSVLCSHLPRVLPPRLPRRLSQGRCRPFSFKSLSSCSTVLPSSLLEVVQRFCSMKVVRVPRGSRITSLILKLQQISELLASKIHTAHERFTANPRISELLASKIQFGLRGGFRYDLQSYDGLSQGHNFANFNCSPIDYNQNESHSYSLPNPNHIPPAQMLLSAQQLLSLTTGVGLNIPLPPCLPVYSTSGFDLMSIIARVATRAPSKNNPRTRRSSHMFLRRGRRPPIRSVHRIRPSFILPAHGVRRS